MGNVLPKREAGGLFTPQEGAPGDLSLTTYRGIDYIAAKTNSDWKYTAIDKIFDGKDTDTVKNVKNYGAIGNGAADEAYAINRAIADLPNGGTVYFPPGVYKIDTKTIILTSKITLRGAGIGATKIDHYKSDSDSIGGVVFRTTNLTDITIRDLEIDGNAVNNGNMGEHDHAFHFEDSDRIFISNCYLHDLSGDGIYFDNCSYAIINNCIISVPNVNASSPQVGRNCIACIEGDHITINNCILIEGVPAGIDLEPVANKTVSDVTITGCTFYGANNTGIAGINLQATESGSICKNITIDGCTIDASNDLGIRISETINWKISNCVIHDCTNHGIYIVAGTSMGSIVDNTCHTNGKNGIIILENCSKIRIAGNICHTNVESGIKIVGTSGNENNLITIRNNDCYNNDSGDTSSFVGIHMDYMDDSQVLGNFCYDDQGSATQLYGFQLINCDDILFGADNYGHDNKSRLINSSDNTVIRHGSIVKLPWKRDDISQNITLAPMSFAGSFGEQCVMDYAGQIIGMSVRATAPISTGSVTINLTKNAAAVGYDLTLDSSNQKADRQDLSDSDSDLLFVEGDTIGMLYTSSATLVPNTTNDITVVVTMKI